MNQNIIDRAVNIATRCAINGHPVSRIKKLEEGIGKVLLWRNFDGDGISDPLRKELYKLIEEK